MRNFIAYFSVPTILLLLSLFGLSSSASLPSELNRFSVYFDRINTIYNKDEEPEVPRFLGFHPDTLVRFTNDTYACANGVDVIPVESVNDDYCDCPDGTDEHGTTACSHILSKHAFYCANEGYLPEVIHSSQVNNGICDCIDGSDEYDLRTKPVVPTYAPKMSSSTSEQTNDLNLKEDSSLSLDNFLAMRKASEQLNSPQSGIPVDVGGQEWEKRVNQCPNHSIVARQSTLEAIKTKSKELEKSLETKSLMFRKGVDSFIRYLKVIQARDNDIVDLTAIMQRTDADTLQALEVYQQVIHALFTKAREELKGIKSNVGFSPSSISSSASTLFLRNFVSLIRPNIAILANPKVITQARRLLSPVKSHFFEGLLWHHVTIISLYDKLMSNIASNSTLDTVSDGLEASSTTAKYFKCISQLQISTMQTTTERATQVEKTLLSFSPTLASLFSSADGIPFDPLSSKLDELLQTLKCLSPQLRAQLEHDLLSIPQSETKTDNDNNLLLFTPEESKTHRLRLQSLSRMLNRAREAQISLVEKMTELRLSKMKQAFPQVKNILDKDELAANGVFDGPSGVVGQYSVPTDEFFRFISTITPTKIRNELMQDPKYISLAHRALKAQNRVKELKSDRRQVMEMLELKRRIAAEDFVESTLSTFEVQRRTEQLVNTAKSTSLSSPLSKSDQSFGGNAEQEKFAELKPLTTLSAINKVHFEKHVALITAEILGLETSTSSSNSPSALEQFVALSAERLGELEEKAQILFAQKSTLLNKPSMAFALAELKQLFGYVSPLDQQTTTADIAGADAASRGSRNNASSYRTVNGIIKSARSRVIPIMLKNETDSQFVIPEEVISRFSVEVAKKRGPKMKATPKTLVKISNAKSVVDAEFLEIVIRAVSSSIFSLNHTDIAFSNEQTSNKNQNSEQDSHDSWSSILSPNDYYAVEALLTSTQVFFLAFLSLRNDCFQTVDEKGYGYQFCALSTISQVEQLDVNTSSHAGLGRRVLLGEASLGTLTPTDATKASVRYVRDDVLSGLPHMTESQARKEKMLEKRGNNDDTFSQLQPDFVLSYPRGTICWPDSTRSASAFFICGPDTHLRRATETRRCTYEVLVETPAACQMTSQQSLTETLDILQKYEDLHQAMISKQQQIQEAMTRREQILATPEADSTEKSKDQPEVEIVQEISTEKEGLEKTRPTPIPLHDEL